MSDSLEDEVDLYYLLCSGRPFHAFKIVSSATTKGVFQATKGSGFLSGNGISIEISKEFPYKFDGTLKDKFEPVVKTPILFSDFNPQTG